MNLCCSDNLYANPPSPTINIKIGFADRVGKEIFSLLVGLGRFELD